MKRAREEDASSHAHPHPKQQNVPEAPPAKKPANDRKNKEVFIYGNYKKYYGYRIERGQQEDPRLAVFRKEWFVGKDCLDIGCNQGVITVGIAKKFSCRSILGIDIDRSLIGDAYRHLHSMVKKEQTSTRLTSGKNVSDMNCVNPEVLQSSDKEIADNEIGNSQSDIHREDCLLNRVSFREANFVDSFHGCSEKYDTILCLSVTKWVHLNWGDDGLITLFVKMWRCLRPGGLLLLEPQPWSSYQKKRKVSEEMKSRVSVIAAATLACGGGALIFGLSATSIYAVLNLRLPPSQANHSPFCVNAAPRSHLNDQRHVDVIETRADLQTSGVALITEPSAS